MPVVVSATTLTVSFTPPTIFDAVPFAFATACALAFALTSACTLTLTCALPVAFASPANADDAPRTDTNAIETSLFIDPPPVTVEITVRASDDAPRGSMQRLTLDAP